jgi:hypothetical protein
MLLVLVLGLERIGCGPYRDWSHVATYQLKSPAPPGTWSARCGEAYRESRAIRRAIIFELRLSFLANYIQTMVNFS